MRQLFCFLYAFLAQTTFQIGIKRFELSQSKKEDEFESNFDTNSNQNLYEINLTDQDVLNGQILFLVFESSNPEFRVSILDGNSSKTQKFQVLMDLQTFSGNLMMVMSDTYFNQKMDFFAESGVLRFFVSNKAKVGEMDYKIRVIVGQEVDLNGGETYTTRVDYMQNDFKVNIVYDGTENPELQKLRFQLTQVRQKDDYELTATLSYNSQSFTMNNIFEKSVGGILTDPELPVCRDKDCKYSLSINQSKVKVMNIESYLIGKIEKLSIQHYEEYYDRVYKDNQITYYELVYEPSMESMDISISLIPVVGSSGLYVNAKTLPTALEKYDWQEKGRLAKRITITWEELGTMKAQKSNLFIAIQTSKSGEYLLKMDAHEPGYRGRLNSGIIEAGFVNFNQINNYLYLFEVYQTQKIKFDLTMNLISGDADLYLKQCESFSDCKIQEADLDSMKLKVTNNHSNKKIQHEFTCETRQRHSASICEFVIGVKGKQNHGSHYDLSLHELKFHRLMTPGHSININLNPNEKVYLKFSYPHNSYQNKLYLSVDSIWGSFNVFMSKTVKYPSLANNSYNENFQSQKAGLYNSMKTIPITTNMFSSASLQGVYYITVESISSCSLNLNFYEKSEKETTVHTLTAGNQIRGSVYQQNELQYYTIKLSLDDKQASSVRINLTPLKGEYTLFVSNKGVLPTKESNTLNTQNNQIELKIDESKVLEEYIIGVQLNTPTSDDKNSYQYIIEFTYSNKPLKMKPSIITTHTLKNENFFLIEVIEEMGDLLILKSVVDGYNLKLCAKFTSSDDGVQKQHCDYEANEKNVSIYINDNSLKQKCKSVTSKSSRCFIQLQVKGTKNQKFSLGYTYNDHPFQLVKGTIVNGPTLVDISAKINFVYHAEPEKPVGIYFNTKGRKMNIFTKILTSDTVKEKSLLSFPSVADYDEENVITKGHSTNIFYDAETVTNFGSSPEILISIRAPTSASSPLLFDPATPFILQTTMGSQEILRTQTLSEVIQENEWLYYNFYNNGNSQNLRIYVSTNVYTKLELQLSRGLQSRPPFTNKALLEISGLGSVDLDISPKDIKTDAHEQNTSLKGHYSLGVRSSNKCIIHLFWNNKEDLNYIEITPGTPSTMKLEANKNFYFSFYAQDHESKKKDNRLEINVYIKTNVRASIFMLKTAGELDAPSTSNYLWKSSTSKVGGITRIQIQPNDPEYCVECTYIGYIENFDDGQVSLMTDIRHNDIPMLISPGFEIPDKLNSQEKIIYRVYNPDTDLIDITLSMLSGFVDIYISKDSTVNEKNYLEKYSLEETLDVHKFIVINPHRYNITTAQNFYIMVKNNKAEESTFTINVDKNSVKSPINPGITKFLHLAPGESTDYFYVPKKEEKQFEVRMELRQVLDSKFMKQALSLLNDYIDIYHMNENGSRYKLKYKKKYVSGNKIYISLDISESTQGTFYLHIYNPVGSGVAISADLLNGGYNLVNLNEYNIDMIENEQSKIYEAHGITDKYLFIDLKMCIGDVNVAFYQEDFENVRTKNGTDYKTIKDANSFIHYQKLNKSRIFVKVSNLKTQKSIYQVSLFNERDLDNNPYTEISQGNKGKVDIETDNNVLKFSPIKMISTYNENFTHRLNYTVYLSNSFKAMRYAKNCGDYLINEAFEKPHLLSFSTVIKLQTKDDIKQMKLIKIPVFGLRGNTKYYGVVVAQIDLLPKEEGYITPVRTGRAYYDEFVFISPKFNIPFNLLISVVVCIGFLICLFCIVRSYIFGKINKFDNFEMIHKNLQQFDDGVLGYNVISILEKEYYENQEHELETQDTSDEQPQEDVEQIEDEEDVREIELSENDKNQPLDPES